MRFAVFIRPSGRNGATISGMHTMRRKDKEITSPEVIDEILSSGQVCHLALHDDPYPYVVPMNYGFRLVVAKPPGADSRVLYFHGACEGRKLELIRRNPRAAFVIDMDHKLITAEVADRFTMQYRSVMGTGIITVLEDPAEKRAGLDAIMAHYSDRAGWSYPEAMVQTMAVFALKVEELSGKRSPAGT